MLHVLPSMGSVTNYALSWDANVKTIQQCHLEAQRETDEMVEFVQLSNDSALTFPVAEAGKKEKPVSKWFNARLPLWRRVAPFPVAPGRYGQLAALPDGKVLYTRALLGSGATNGGDDDEVCRGFSVFVADSSHKKHNNELFNSVYFDTFQWSFIFTR